MGKDHTPSPPSRGGVIVVLSWYSFYSSVGRRDSGCPPPLPLYGGLWGVGRGVASVDVSTLAWVRGALPSETPHGGGCSQGGGGLRT